MLQNRPKKECHRQVKLPRFSRNINTLISEQPLKLYLFKIQQYIRFLTIIIEIHKIHKSKPFFPLFKSTLKLSFFTSQKNTLSTLFSPSKIIHTKKIKSSWGTRVSNLPFKRYKKEVLRHIIKDTFFLLSDCQLILISKQLSISYFHFTIQSYNKKNTTTTLLHTMYSYTKAKIAALPPILTPIL